MMIGTWLLIGIRCLVVTLVVLTMAIVFGKVAGAGWSLDTSQIMGVFAGLFNLFREIAVLEKKKRNTLM